MENNPGIIPDNNIPGNDIPDNNIPGNDIPGNDIPGNNDGCKCGNDGCKCGGTGHCKCGGTGHCNCGDDGCNVPYDPSADPLAHPTLMGGLEGKPVHPCSPYRAQVVDEK